jgi:hypothetical protein
MVSLPMAACSRSPYCAAERALLPGSLGGAVDVVLQPDLAKQLQTRTWMPHARGRIEWVRISSTMTKGTWWSSRNKPVDSRTNSPPTTSVDVRAEASVDMVGSSELIGVEDNLSRTVTFSVRERREPRKEEVKQRGTRCDEMSTQR